MSTDGVPMEFGGELVTPTQRHIRSFQEIPDIITLEVPPVEYIVPAIGIARNTITLWTGADGDGKTYLVQAMAVAVSRGGEFLGMLCQKAPVLYMDLENPAYAVQDRLRPMTGEQSIPELKVWGTWNQQQPPLHGSELLLTIAKETKPVIIVDPFRYFHTAEENDSTAMAEVMKYLRACAAYGCAVIILHHPAKAEGSTGRGSSAIRGACDLAFLHSLDKESQLITLKVDKNRNGESRTITIRADFEEGRFEVTDAPYITRRKDELAKIAKIIADNPGITQNGLKKSCGMNKTRLTRLLKEGVPVHWRTKPGPYNSICYLPVSAVSGQAGTTETTAFGSGGAVSLSHTLYSETTRQPAQAANEHLCSFHGWHSEWFSDGGIYLCRRCHPDPSTLSLA